ncbi:NAD(P)H-hydrate dehydratase [Arachnia propionica]|uniref:ADP-dependent (S)-NAD(P)H-hydrate dehydratase n=1 Tax=Arachnia propionica TaxID=1750 RepID=A0AB37I8S4_9ACTN|nr:NAD(P)H-hydrate dehydratase [Arachnia propionica]QUC12059.1 NAD(P)H-hydrate dehydratase [Arachnia propionica]RPA18866.1 NAD(P)H-hydrate dehydratase [Arachnia propionica]
MRGVTGVVTAGEIAAWWPVPGAESHKYTRGVVGIDAGSPQYPGAALLAISGALGAGPGMVRYLGSAPRDLVVGRFPSVVLADGQVQAVVAGSGWGALVDAGPRLREALERRVPLVIDADALRLLPADLPAETLLTPHAGELARLLGVERGEIEADPVAAAVLAAGRFGATVLLKGAVQPVASPDGSVRLALSGPAWTAQAGSGDVLAGACGTLLAAGLPAGRAGLMAASLQALTASRFPGPYPPDVQASRFPEVVWGLLAPDQQ